MAMSFVKLHFDFLETAEEMSDEEAGRLFKAVLHYAATNEQPRLSGPERLVFSMLRAQIDRDRGKYEAKASANRENGKRGGRPSKTQVVSEETQETHSVFEKPTKRQKKEKEEEEEEEKEKEDCLAIHTDSSGSRERACAREEPAAGVGGDLPEENPFGNRDGPRPSFDTLEVYAANNLAALTPGNMEELAAFKADLAEELIRHAIDEAAANGKRTWNYVRSILRRYLDTGYKTLGEALAAEEQRRGAQHGIDRADTSADEWDSLDPERKRIFELAVANGA